MTHISIETARGWDQSDVLRHFRERFELPPKIVYLDGNSLGALPRDTALRVSRVVSEEWGRGLIRGWTTHDWYNAPLTVGAKIAKLIGAADDEVVVTDSTTVNLFRLVLAALSMQPEKAEILCEAGDFPTDLYVCQGASAAYGRGRTFKIVPRDRLSASIDSNTAVVLLSHVHYRTGEIYDMQAVTEAAHRAGALVLWDLSHSTGAIPVALNKAGADFAAGCGYKYLNGGPAAPAYLYVAQRHQSRATNAISGWLGHARPFDFVDQYEPATGIRRFLSGACSVIACRALEVGVDLLLEAGMDRVREKSRRLSALFIELVESECDGYGLKLVSPRQADWRGSQASYSHPHGFEIMQALISDSIIGDFRAPDVLRFGFTPLYTSFEDVFTAVARLRTILREERWKDPVYAVRGSVVT